LNKKRSIFNAFIFTALIVTIFGCVTGEGEKSEKTTTIKSDILQISFENGIPDFMSNGNSDYEVVKTGATDGEYALKVVYHPAQFSNVKFIPENPWDWGVDNCLSLDVTNPSDEVLTFYVKVSDETDENKATVSIASIQPHSTQSIYMGFSPKSLDLGMRNFPESPAGTNIGYGWGKTSLNISHIYSFNFWMMDVVSDKTLYFDNIRVIPDPDKDISFLDGFINEYGQNSKIDWEGKIKKDSDLVKSRKREAKELKSDNDITSSRSQYGGWLDGPKLEATGYFRTEKYNGKWTLVDPEGYLFIATGLDIVRLTDTVTWLSGREKMFDPMPDRNGKYGSHYVDLGQVARSPLKLTSGVGYNYYTANLEKKYGKNYVEEWKNTTLDRMKSWGFTTLGNWSEPDLFYGNGEENRLPYAAQGWINGNFARIGNDDNQFWRPIPDAFDPEFREATKKVLADLVKKGVDKDKWCMGIYLDNEIAWGNPINPESTYAIPISVLKMDSNNQSSYAKKAIIDALKDKYSDISELNKSWKSDYSSWEMIEKPFDIGELNNGKISDLSLALKLIANEYFKVVDQELQNYMPNILNLGVRFAEWGTSLEVQEACATYADVVSYNVYKKGVDDHKWIFIEELDKPAIVGEFMFRASERGYIGTGIHAVPNLYERGESYKEYIKSILNSPYFVGAHWFQYMDQPLTGRAWDGENYNAGFVDTTDEPYTDLVNAAKEIHKNVYDYKFNPVLVSEVKLSEKSALLNLEDKKQTKLSVEVYPEEAPFKNIKWVSSNPSVATVNSEGVVIAKAGGVARITAISKNNTEITDVCEVKVKGKSADFPKLSFEEGVDTDFFLFNGDASTEYLTDGVTDGEKSVKVSVKTLDKNYGALVIDAPGTWSFGDNPVLKVDMKNPNSEKIQIRMNVADANGALRTYFFNLAPNEQRTGIIDSFAAHAPKWDGDGYWGAKDTGVDSYSINKITFYLWEEQPDLTSDSFIIDNVRVESIE